MNVFAKVIVDLGHTTNEYIFFLETEDVVLLVNRMRMIQNISVYEYYMA